MATFVKLNKSSVTKGSGKQNVDDAALKDFALGLREGLSKFRNEDKQPTYQVWTVEDKLKPEPTTGYAVDSTLKEIKITIAGAKGTVSVQTSISVGTWPKTLMFGFGANGANGDGGTRDKDLEKSAGDAAYGAGEALAGKVDFAIKAKEKKDKE